MLPNHKPDSLHSAKATPQTRPSKKTERIFQNDLQDDALPAYSAGKFSVSACYNQEHLNCFIKKITINNCLCKAS